MKENKSHLLSHQLSVPIFKPSVNFHILPVKLSGFFSVTHIKGEFANRIMSYVHLFIIKDDCTYLASVHYRTAMKLLEKGVDDVLPMLKSRFLDAGYLVLDLNKRIIINGQSAFPVGRAIGKKEFYVLDA